MVGVAAMFTACKYEEIYAPELKDFVYVCDHAYSKEDILGIILFNMPRHGIKNINDHPIQHD